MATDRPVMIGLEIHIELDTESKLFCSCPSSSFEPNTAVCPVCLGHPGAKPVLNKKVVDFALRLCLALGCKTEKELIFSRKSYFYPDLSKNFQITQFELPIGKGGIVRLSGDKEINIRRLHIEEDPASIQYPGPMQDSGYVLVDYNRSGCPLIELVTEPDLTSPEQAREFIKKLISIASHLGIFDKDKGTIKADANISVKESGFTRVEIKNISGAKQIEKALEYEINRQKHDLSEGRKIIFETRGWDSAAGKTFSLRTKESEEDYGYIIEPDLIPIKITDEMLARAKQSVPILPEQRADKYVADYGIARDDADAIVSEPGLVKIFEKVIKKIEPKFAAKWIRKELLRVMNYNKISFKDLLIDEKHIVDLLTLINEGKISDKIAGNIIERIVKEPMIPSEIVKKESLEAVSDNSKLEEFCKKAIADNPSASDDYKKGRQTALNFLVGRVMKASHGKAKPDTVKKILKTLLD